jgi:hypothetical protein
MSRDAFFPRKKVIKKDIEFQKATQSKQALTTPRNHRRYKVKVTEQDYLDFAALEH